jgi:alpha-beta hydrolase superfamily lysophospholipase
MTWRATARLLPAAAAALWLAACTPTILPMGTPIGQPLLLDDGIVTADGLFLPLRTWRPEGAPRAVILALHGFNDYSNAFDTPAAEWARSGILTYAYDQRGFGRAPNTGIWPGTETLVADLEVVTRLIAQRHAGLPLYVLGESMGAAVILVAATEHRIPAAAGTILVAPAVRARETLTIFERFGLWFFSRTLPWLAGYPGSPTGHHPSDNIAMLRAYSRDPLVIKNTRIDTFWGLVNLMDDGMAAARRFDSRALIQIGARDDLIPDSPSRLMLDRLPELPAGQRRVAVYRRGYHMLLRDLNAGLPVGDISFWALNRDAASPLPSGAEHAAGPGFAERGRFR